MVKKTQKKQLMDTHKRRNWISALLLFGSRVKFEMLLWRFYEFSFGLDVTSIHVSHI